MLAWPVPEDEKYSVMASIPVQKHFRVLGKFRRKFGTWVRFAETKNCLVLWVWSEQLWGVREMFCAIGAKTFGRRSPIFSLDFGGRRELLRGTLQRFRIVFANPTGWGLCPQTPEVFWNQRRH